MLGHLYQVVHPVMVWWGAPKVCVTDRADKRKSVPNGTLTMLCNTLVYNYCQLYNAIPSLPDESHEMYMKIHRFTLCFPLAVSCNFHDL